MPPELGLGLERSETTTLENVSGKNLRKFQDVPPVVLEILSRLLRPPHRNDWKSLAGALGFSVETVSLLGYENDPVIALFKEWSITSGNEATVDQLLTALRSIRRLDCIEDIQKYIDQMQVSNHERIQKTGSLKCIERSWSTVDERYDVFISYAEEDRQFARFLLLELEKLSFKVCIDYRDFLPGAEQIDQLVDVIENRCRKVIVILTDAYNSCEMSDFQAKLALSLSPSGRRRILIPVLYQPCEIPRALGILSRIDYSKKDLRSYFWTTLKKALGKAIDA